MGFNLQLGSALGAGATSYLGTTQKLEDLRYTKASNDQAIQEMKDQAATQAKLKAVLPPGVFENGGVNADGVPTLLADPSRGPAATQPWMTPLVPGDAQGAGAVPGLFSSMAVASAPPRQALPLASGGP